MKTDLYGEKTFEEFYCFEIPKENDVDISAFSLSNRVVHALVKNEIFTLVSLVKLRIKDFEQIRNLGKSSIEEVHTFVGSIAKDGVLCRKRENAEAKLTVSRAVYANLENILSGDLEFAEMLGEEEKRQVSILAEAVEVLGRDLAKACLEASSGVFGFMASLRGFCRDAEGEFEQKRRIQVILDAVPKERHEQKAIGYIKAYTRDEEKRALLSRIYGLEDRPNARLNAPCYSVVKESFAYFMALSDFLKWCSFDIKADLDALFAVLHERDNVKAVMQARANGVTLQEIGNRFGITRERVRQIEAKGRQFFEAWQNRTRILTRISAIRDDDTVLSSVELREYFDDYYAETVYLLRLYESPAYHYDAQLDVFVLGEESLTAAAFELVESLPNSFDEAMYSEIEAHLAEKEIPAELFRKALFDSYQKDGSTYHRTHQTLTEIYTNIMNVYYADGLNVYDEAEMREFKRIAVEEYGCTKLPANDKAIYARIQDFCILCGKGKYKPKSEKYISKDLERRIYAYITESPATIFLTNTIFSVFEDELAEYGIENKYYMSGVLRELFSNEFFFRRDYISKDDTATSLYAELVQFIKTFDTPVSKDEIYGNFPGLPEIVLQMALLDPNVINLFGRYLHAEKLPLRASDQMYFRNLLKRFLAQEQVVHYNDLYRYAVQDSGASELMTRLFIDKPVALFAVLECAMGREYQCKRPYIAEFGVEIGNPAEQLREIVVNSEVASFADIASFMKENRCGVHAYLDYYNSYSDTHLIASNTELATFRYLGIDEDIGRQAVDVIEDAVTQSMPIRELPCHDRLPKINVPWHEWLVYSVIRKWSNKLELSVTNSTFKYAIPMVARKSESGMELRADGEGAPASAP